MNILEKADQIVNHRSEEKERMYGPFGKSMERAAAIYNAASPENEQISVQGMYRALIALKLSREAAVIAPLPHVLVRICPNRQSALKGD